MSTDRDVDDRLVMMKVQPYIRGILAFILYLRFPAKGPEGCYKDANIFIDRLFREMK